MNRLRTRFSTNLRKLREKAGMSRALFAELTHMHVTHIAHFEHGRRLPNLGNLIQLADVLKVSLDHLVGRREE